MVFVGCVGLLLMYVASPCGEVSGGAHNEVWQMERDRRKEAEAGRGRDFAPLSLSDDLCVHWFFDTDFFDIVTIHNAKNIYLRKIY